MHRRKVAVAIVAAAVVLGAAGCMITLRPEWAELRKPTREPILRLGEVKERFTGTWAGEALSHTIGIRNGLLRALGEPEAAALFSGDPDNLVVNLDIVSDHEADPPRLFLLGCVSIFTLGLLPLSYHSEWNVQCEVTIRGPEGSVAAKYPTRVTGSYNIYALPPTMFTLFAASFRGPRDGAQVFRRMANNLAADILKAVATDYPRLAKWKEARALVAGQRPIAVVIGEAPYWVVYNIAAEGRRRDYVLELHRERPQPGAAPLRSLVVGTRAAAAGAAWQWREPKSVVLFAHGRLWYPTWETEGPGEKLAAVEFRERRVPAKELLAPGSLPALSPSEWNDFLVGWKNRELVAVLREGTAADLREHASGIEQLVLRANAAAERERDKAQALIAAGKPGAELHAGLARTYHTRIEVLKPILAAIKAELVSRQR